MSGSNIYFASDLHLGIPSREASLERERKFVSWLEMASKDAKEVHLMGDIFDFWFEYKHAIPRGHIRLMGKIAELTDKGIKVYWYYGNHDMWIFDYIPQELGVEMVPNELVKEYGGKRFFLHHGDGLGPGDKGYKVLKQVFRSRLCQWLFARLHPNFGIGVANYFSKTSRNAEQDYKKGFQGEENEWLLTFCKDKLKEEHFDYLIFGHRHLPLDIAIDQSRYVNLGDWIHHFTYAVFDGQQLELKKFEQ
ncbi:MAG: UDP-2,3-diacylglucosamine diphosphatase [Flavobacteriales bacterium]|nr:UDP-2,3-diacylglucosamine diphosphatase [Flavobacteriales bacterium]